MKKRLLSIVLAGALAASLVACGGSSSGGGNASSGGSSSSDAAADSGSSDSGSSDSGAASADGGDHTLTLWAWDAAFNIPAMVAAEKDYQEVDPEFKLNIVEQSQSSDCETAVTTAAESGDYSQLPDITLFQDHWFQQYCINYPDAWISADDADCDWSGLGAEKLSYSTVNGVHYGFPVDAGTAIFAYQTDYLAAAGYTIDDVTGITWDRFIEIGKDVYAATGKYLLCMDGDGNDLFYMMCQEEGVSQWKNGEPFIVGNDTLEKVFNIVCEMAKNNVLYLANDWGDYTDQAIQGDMVAGVYNGNWIIPTIEKVESNKGKWAITSCPTLSGKEGYASNGGSSLYITSNCKNPDLAKKFLSYTFGGGSAADGTSTTYDEALLNGGVIGTCAAAAKSDVYQQGVDYFNGQSIYADIVGYTQNVPTVEQNDYHYSLRGYLATAAINVVNGADVASELANAEQNIRFEMGL